MPSSMMNRTAMLYHYTFLLKFSMFILFDSNVISNTVLKDILTNTGYLNCHLRNVWILPLTVMLMP